MRTLLLLMLVALVVGCPGSSTETEPEAAEAVAVAAVGDASDGAVVAGAVASDPDVKMAGAEPAVAGAAASIPSAGEAEPTTSADPRLAVLTRILGTAEVPGWTVGSAFDLGSMKMATLSRDQDAQAVTAVVLESSARGVPHTELLAAFQSAEASEDGKHPLEILGYDLVQPKAAGILNAEAGGQLRKLPRLDYAWMRVDEDSGEREAGSGVAVWIRCEEPGDAGQVEWSTLMSVESSKDVKTDGLVTLIGATACR